MFVLVVVALLAGVLGGMGMGGGTLYIPALTLLLGVPQRLAQWLNLASFVPMAAISLVIHAHNKRLDGKSFAYLFVPALATAIPFAYLATRLYSRLLSLLFGGFLTLLGAIGLVIATVKAIQTLRRNTPKEPED